MYMEAAVGKGGWIRTLAIDMKLHKMQMCRRTAADETKYTPASEKFLLPCTHFSAAHSKNSIGLYARAPGGASEKPVGL
jgi:hypothetical protein